MKKTIACLLFGLIGFMVKAQNDTTEAAITDQNFQEQLIKEMDEMLDLWYIKSQIPKAINSSLYDDTTDVVFSDSLIYQRLRAINTVVPLAYNNSVKRWIELYVYKRKKSSSVLMGLSTYYYPFMREIFDKYGVPEELIYLTIIESGLNPIAVSRMGATGIWQFMHGTGKVYGLEVNTFVDDRRDPIKATDAAARHLKDLYNIFNDWGLAISAYNCGAGNVRKAISRSGGKTDFWSVRSYLPRETQNYFPAYIAALYLVTYHQQHGIPSAKISIPFAVDTVMIHHELHFEQISAVLEIDMEEIKILNPQYKRMVIPAYSEPYPLRLQNKDIIRFIELKDSICQFKYADYFTPIKVYQGMFTGEAVQSTDYKKQYHTVKSKETLASISAKYGLSVTELKQMNKLKSNYVKPKQRLFVGYEYTGKSLSEVSTDSTKVITPIDSTKIDPNSATVQSEKPASGIQKEVIYIVKKGDTLNSIAKKHNTTINKLITYNKIKNANSIHVGQKIKIPSR
ncbi:MAG TPA: transglycosylase SLT domain-containing protein [Bacteroidales bacterium]|nr:transglycosylase SLT domain-containing protein [Bacteroidales bacterium]